MKDPIVQEIHRRRAAYAKRFNYNVRAIGDDVRRSEAESGGKFAASIPRGNRRLKRTARKVSAAAWDDEIARRAKEIQSGAEKGIPADDVMKEARHALNETRRLPSARRK